MKKYLFFYFLLYTIKKSLFKKSFKYNSLPSVTACITNKRLHGPTRGSTWNADTSRAPAEHFRCLFKIILTSFLHWGEKQNAGLQRDKTHCCKLQQRICPPPWEVYQDNGNSYSWRPAPAQAHHRPFWPLSPMPSRVGGEQDGPVQSPRATFSFRGKKMLHKMVPEVQKSFNEKNLNKVFFQVENTVGATRAISPAAIAMWFIHISINGLFLQEVGVIVVVAHISRIQERLACPPPAMAPLLQVGFAQATLSMAEVSQALGWCCHGHLENQSIT